MKKRLVQTITADETTFGQVSHPDDLMKAEDFLHERISETVRDFLNNNKPTECAGFPYELGGGNGFSIAVKKPGRVYTQDGLSFELLVDTTLTISAADEDSPRLDLVVAVLDDAVEANTSLIPFVRLRTSDEFSDAVPPYPPANMMAARELHWRAVPQLKTGTPASIPSIPTLNSNEVPLYLIKVAPGATQIRDADVLDMREVILTLRQINELATKNKIDLSTLAGRVDAVETLVNQPIDLSAVFGSIRSLGDILTALQRQLDDVRDLPEIRYVRPKVALTDYASAQLPAVSLTDSSGIAPVQVVDIEIGGSVHFGNSEIFLSPDKFADSDLFARVIKKVDNPETEQLTTEVNINDVEQVASDGFADFVAKASSFDASRSRPACAARNNQFVEIFGGLASNNATSLSDWNTYDVLNDTLTPLTPSVVLPASDRPALMPLGDGANLLLICGNHTTQAPRCFTVNASTSVVTEIVDLKPTGDQFFGDLIAPGKIFVVALRKELAGVVTEFWLFEFGEFSLLGTTGSVPSLEIDYAHGCYYDLNQFVLVKFTPNETASGRTYIFNLTSSMWTEINIPAPYGDNASKQNPLSRFRLANINGRPLLVGGLLDNETDFDAARIWELRTSKILTSVVSHRKEWISWNATFPPVQDAGLCSTINGGFATGGAVLLAGQGRFSDSKDHVYASVQGGLIATTYKGLPAISIADSSTFVQFVVPSYITEATVSSYLLNIVGEYDSRNLQVEVSLDGGSTYHPFKPERSFSVPDSDTPGNRILRVTMFNLKSSKPIISQFVEFFDQDGMSDLEGRVVIRYQPPALFDGALYVGRDGTITLSATVEPSTPDKCLLHKLTHNTGAPFTVKNYINLRRPRVKYSKVKSGSAASTKFLNELAVPARFVSASAFKADLTVYHLADPTVGFDQEITVSGVATNGDTWIVEISG